MLYVNFWIFITIFFVLLSNLFCGCSELKLKIVLIFGRYHSLDYESLPLASVGYFLLLVACCKCP